MSPGTGGRQPGSEFRLEPREGYLYLHLEPGFEMTPASMENIWMMISDACCFREFVPDRQTGFFRTAAMNRGAHGVLPGPERSNALAGCGPGTRARPAG